MVPDLRVLIVAAAAVLGTAAILRPSEPLIQQAPAAGAPAASSAVLVELFTSEGCSSCPPADELLRQVSGQRTNQGQLIVGISEHVSYWDHLGWKDPFSSQFYTNRQTDYSQHFGLEGVYTPQMVVNGREEFVGSDRQSLAAAFATEAARKQIDLHILSAQMSANSVDFNYSAAGIPDGSRLQLFAVLVDDSARSNVLRGENSGRELAHASVARSFALLGTLRPTEQHAASLPLPASFRAQSGTGHHLVLFAQQSGAGAVLGVDTRPV